MVWETVDVRNQSTSCAVEAKHLNSHITQNFLHSMYILHFNMMPCRGVNEKKINLYATQGGTNHT